MRIDWLKSPLICAGEEICEPLCPDSLSDSDLKDICFRMHLILDSIEFIRCEGRLLPRDIFDAIDTLESRLQFNTDNHLKDWIEWIEKFGAYYDLDGKTPIIIDSRSYEEIRKRGGLREFS